MKKVIGWIRDHWRSDFDPIKYLVVGLLLVVLIIFNYRLDFEDQYIDAYSESGLYPILFFAVHFVPYAITIGILRVFGGLKIEHPKAFWSTVAALMAILAFDRGVNIFEPIYGDVLGVEGYYLKKTLGNLNGLIAVVIPAILLYLFFDRRHLGHFYGLSLKKPGIKTYLWLLIPVAGLALLATFLPGFDEVYPKYLRSFAIQVADQHQWPHYRTIVPYEVCYLLDFVFIEFFFRGLLVFGVVRFLGKDAILPMAVTYMVLHFGKPMGEAIGSFFGGYLLGILALYGNRIWGGIILHMGLALAMEVVSFVVL